jgi:hypothetical protein
LRFWFFFFYMLFWFLVIWMFLGLRVYVLWFLSWRGRSVNRTIACFGFWLNVLTFFTRTNIESLSCEKLG